MRHILFLLLWLDAAGALAQAPSAEHGRSNWADCALVAIRNTQAREPKATLEQTNRLLREFTAKEDRCAVVEVYTIRSLSFVDVGQLDSAMSDLQHALVGFGAPCDSALLLETYVAMTKLYLSLREYDRVDSVALIGISLWKPHNGAAKQRNALLTNSAIAHAQTGDIPGAEVNFHTILRYAIQEGNPQDMEDASSNLGAIKTMTGQLDSAVFYFTKAMQSARANKKLGRIGTHFSNLSAVAEKRKDLRAAVRLLDSSQVYAVRAGDLSLQVKNERKLSKNYHLLGDDVAAYAHAVEHRWLNDSLMSAEKVKSMAEMQEKYESEKKVKEILGLKAANLEGELDKARVKRIRNFYLFGGIGLFVVAGALWSRLCYVDRARVAIQKEKDVSEGLLHNILPEEVAAEIKAKGFADVREFPVATVLFTDFKGFTLLSEKLTAQQLVAEIDHCFIAFDAIMETYGIEKIKTIGDAYMAAGGLPDSTKGAPHDVVLAALAMQDFMCGYKKEREATGRLFFEMRLGIHTGPVIAGIVGVKKYAYDIWGDTVNTASRMESSGEVGQVNISGATYTLVKDVAKSSVFAGVSPQNSSPTPGRSPGQADNSELTTLKAFTFTPRGKVQAKGKGELEMFFVGRNEDVA